MMKILIISTTPWDNNNSFGNTFSNLFEAMDDIEIASIYCQHGKQENNIVTKSYQMSELEFINKFFGRNKGKSLSKEQDISLREKSDICLTNKQNNIYNWMRKNNFYVFYFFRELIWKISNWNKKELHKFIDDFKPDMIYLPIYHCVYMNNISLAIYNYAKVPMIAHITDDIYTNARYRFSPLFWIHHFFIRRSILKVVSKCSHIDVFAENMKEVYSKVFNKECQIIAKGYDFVKQPTSAKPNQPLKLLFTGNISSGRWESLAEIGKALDIINSNEIKAELLIYTATPVSSKMARGLKYSSIKMMGTVSSTKIPQIQRDADILVHVESFNKRYFADVKMSFSTKIIDYLYQAKPLFAIGPKEVASMDYLIKNDAAITADLTNLKSKLQILLSDERVLKEYADKAWDCGKKNHQITEIQQKLINSFNTVIERKDR